MEVVELADDMYNICENLRKNGIRIRFVPTMGALHDGHASLIECARSAGADNRSAASSSTRAPPSTMTTTALAPSAQHSHHNHDHKRHLTQPGAARAAPPTHRDTHNSNADHRQTKVAVIVSIFVNPTQFNNAADFRNYPLTLDDDLALCRKLNVNFVFVPSLAQMYPPHGPNSGRARHCTVSPPRCLANELEGKSRSGHFEGVLTVVCKFFSIIRPHDAYFGEKDYQQLVLVDQMSQDLAFNVHIRPVATVRHADMLPLSSRNVRLSKQGRLVAPVMYKILVAAQQALQQCKQCPDLNVTILASMMTTLCLELHGHQDGAAMFSVDYFEIRCAKDLSALHYNRDIGAYDCQEACFESQQHLHNDSPQYLDARLLISAIVDGVRLLDNIGIKLNGDNEFCRYR